MTTASSTRPSAPRLIFDDGSRAIQESIEHDVSSTTCCPRGSIPLADFYQLDHLASQLAEYSNSNIALQFPDELLQDAPMVCQYLQEALSDSALVFVLGDTTFAPCCPDVVAAQHLQAHVLVHFGHACLTTSTTGTTNVLYCFGNNDMDIHDCVDQVIEHGNDYSKHRRIILLYDTSYQHAMEELQTRLSEQGDALVITGYVKRQKQRREVATALTINTGVNARCNTVSGSCVTSNGSCEKHTGIEDETHLGPKLDEEDDHDESEMIVIGGLEIPSNLDWSSFILLYVGNSDSRHFRNIAMRLLSSESKPAQFWNYDPLSKQLNNSLSPAISRMLNRRFYLVNKARQVSVFGLLIANLTDTRIQKVVAQLQRLLDDCQRSSYTICVGKITPAKLANFAEIESYVLLACSEHALLDDESDFATPVLTPFELLMALNVVKWGDRPYSTNIEDCLVIAEEYLAKDRDEHDNSDTDDDQPYFNVATGQYESAPMKEDANINLQALPGQGQLTAYKSVAADFLKRREYKGLQVRVGDTEVRAAIPGQQGIPSNYGDR